VKKAILINSLFNGGAEKVVSILLNELAKNNAGNIELICIKRNDFYEIDKRIKITYLTDSIEKENGIKKLIYLPILALKLKKYIKENDITLVQSHIYRANYVNVLSKMFGAGHNAQVVNTGQIGRYKQEGLLGKVNLFLIKYLYPRADLIICKSYGMLDDMQKIFSFSNQKIVINNPYDIDKIESLSNEKADDFEFDTNKKYIVAVGRLIKLKRSEDLLITLSKLPTSIEVLFLGDGEEKENLISFSKVLGIDNRCHFFGRVSNPYKYMSKCDFFVSCSETEGFPNVLVEAMICGLPVISSDCISGPREILAPNTNIESQLKDNFELAGYGILFPVSKVETIIEAINILNKDDKMRINYIGKGQIRSKDFSLDKIVKKYNVKLRGL
jgi:glycosyltransferase involved in cell wall biosynthesis